LRTNASTFFATPDRPIPFPPQLPLIRSPIAVFIRLQTFKTDLRTSKNITSHSNIPINFAFLLKINPKDNQPSEILGLIPSTMKKVLFAAALAVLSAAPALAQKVGHVNIDSLLVLMPEYKTAMASLEAEQAKFENEAREMQAELEKSAAAMQSASAGWSELRKQQETKQLQDAYANIQSYMQSAQESLQTKEVELLTPVLEKMQKAIEEVAAAQKLAYVIDSSRSKGVLVYQKGGDNLMKAVKTKLAIK
jgi:outer membrane protein